MGSKFVEKHKRKSVLAALLFIFQGRAKYVSIMLMVTVLSVPFVISGETLNSMIELPGVAAFLRSVGLSSVVSSVNPKYSNDLLKAAMEKAAVDSQQNSFWQKFLKSINATMPANGGPSSIAMIRGGGDLFGPPELKDEVAKQKRGPGEVKGVVNEEEKARGDSGDDVSLEGLLAKAGGNGGDQMGAELASNFAAGGAGGDSGPYVNRTMFGGGGSEGKTPGMYSNVMGQSASKVPVPGGPQKVNTKRMGRVSGFTWKNVGFNKANAKVDVKIGNKKPMFQLAQTFAMTATAWKAKDSALEYQAAYTGTTYDGNDSNLDVIQTDANPPAVPDTSYTSTLTDGAVGMQDAAKICSDAQGTNGAKMSEDGKLMDDTAKSLGKPPKCCSGGVGAWNAKIDRIISYCNDFNVNEAELSAKCQNKSSPMDCNSYNGMHIKPCSKLKCFLSMLLAILMIIVGAILCGIGLGAIGVGLIAAGAGLIVQQMFPGIFGMLLGALVSMGVGFFGAQFVTVGMEAAAVAATEETIKTISIIGGGAGSAADQGSK